MIITNMTQANVVSIAIDYNDLSVLKLALLSLDLPVLEQTLQEGGFSLIAMGALSQIVFCIDNLQKAINSVRDSELAEALQPAASGMTVN